MSPRTILSLLALAGAASLAAAQPSAPAAKKTIINPEITREGTGPRRELLTTKELGPYDATVWSKISKWAANQAPAPADLSGQVVLVCTWKHYHPASKRAMELARKLAIQYAGKGLTVVTAHDTQGWDEGQKLAALPADASKETRFFIGFDEKGDFRKAIDSDGDPDFYLIDRAGQLRFADIATESVEQAVKILIPESAEAAAGINAKLAGDAEKQRRDAARTAAARESVDMSSIPALPPGYNPPTPEQFAAARFPDTIMQAKDENSSSGEKKAPPVIQLPDGEGWYPAKPELQGRVWVVYFWDFDEYRTYSIMQKMDELQKARGRDIAVVGIMTKFPKENTSGNENKPAEDPLKQVARMLDFTRGKSLQHATFYEPSGQLLTASRGAERAGANEIPIPYAVVCSSDGTVRFSGWPTSPSFLSSLDNTLNADPGVKARRTADAAYIKSKSK